MIKEIVEFMNVNKGLEHYFHTDYEKTFIIFNNNKNIRIIDVGKGFAKEYWLNDNLLEFKETNLEEVDKFIKYSTAIPNKQLNKNKGSGGANPFIHTFIYKMDSIYDNKIQFINSLNEKKKLTIDKIYSRIKAQFESAIDKKFYKSIDDKQFLQNIYDTSIDIVSEVLKERLLIYFLKNKLNSKILENPKTKNITRQIVLVFNYPKHIKSFYEAYLKKKTFNKEIDNLKKQCKANEFQKGNCPICNKKRVLSSPSELTNYDVKKGAFIKKTGMGLEYNIKICRTCSLTLNRYRFLVYNKLTNPLPLFIDNKSLFVETIKLIDNTEKRKRYRDMLKTIYYRNPKDLKNFYLLYQNVVGNQKNIQIKDLDYVENFQYMTNIKIMNFLDISYSPIIGNFYNQRLSVFQFEKIINELIFENKLQKNYFSDYKDINITYWKINSNNTNTILKNYLINYRQNFYDFIYKSHFSALKEIDFREMLLDIIIDNIKHDRKNDGFSVYKTEIREKLNFLFSIKEEMLDSNELVYLKEKLKQSLGWREEYKDGDKIKKRFIAGVDHIELKDENDKLFAYLVGQFARYLLSLSKKKKENLTHADFVGFLDWYNSKLLKKYVLDIFQKYAHELKYSSQNRKIENAVSIIQSYKEDLEMDSVKEYLIAGYFADNYFYKKTEELEENENE